MYHELRHAARQLRRVPGMAFLVIFSLALGIGANTAIFSVVNGLVRPLPVRDPRQIVVLANRVKGDRAGLRYQFSYPALSDLRLHAGTFSDLFGFDVQLGGLTIGPRTNQFMYSVVTGNYFSALGLQPAAGRFFLPGEGETRNCWPWWACGPATCRHAAPCASIPLSPCGTISRS